jgi:hypothetical protein
MTPITSGAGVNEYTFVGTKAILDSLAFLLIVKFSLYSMCDGRYEPLLQPTSNEEIVNTIPSWSCSLNLYQCSWYRRTNSIALDNKD